MTTKICSKCNKELNLECFVKNKSEKDGHYHYCKKCRINIRKEEYRKNKLNSNFIKKQKEYSKWYGKNYKQKIKEAAKKQRIKLRKIIFNHYGKKCVCCGENDLFALTIDHINNDGYIHRKKISLAGHNFYRWLINNDFPKGFQVLCWNCNEEKRGNNGILPEWRKNKYIGVS
jgi:hypothetical protein